MEEHDSAEPVLAHKRPFLTVQHAVVLAEMLFNFKQRDGIDVEEFNSCDDRNFHLIGKLGENHQTSREFVLKVLNYVDSANRNLVNAFMALMKHMKNEGFSCPVPVKTAVNDKYYAMCKLPWKTARKIVDSTATDDDIDDLKTVSRSIVDGIEIYSGQGYKDKTECVCAVWMLHFVPGKLFHEVPCTAQLLHNCGQYLAKLHLSLKKFSHSGLDWSNQLVWSLCNMLRVRQYTRVLKEQHQIVIVDEVMDVFSTDVLPHLSSLEKQVIHGDWNANNILVSQDANGSYFVSGFIDIAHSQNSYRVFDVSAGMAYMLMLDNAVDMNFIDAVGHFLAGYQSCFALSETELEMIHGLIAARCCQSLVYGAYKYEVLDPTDPYAVFTAKKGWKAFEKYWKTPKGTLLSTWRNMFHSTCHQVQTEH